ncbi:MAG: tripartite tricarboxylate transporter TctB family protein [Spirochaetae bacterium HGW-Spirochaetae-3]|jgi:putative tricarboxylic transport membrane protein|nr:MAG: tripartite tricarboxylate transporter TctB family protein [Spirochaetae bacterium HGW-Spirochaetae-3]
MDNRWRDIICAVLFIAFGVFMFVVSTGIDPIVANDVGSGFVPRIIAGAIVALAVVLLVLSVLKKRVARTEKADEDLKGGVFTVLALAAYVFLFDRLGFLVSTALYLFVQMTILSNRENRKFKLFAVLALVVPALIYLIFTNLFDMALPAGIIRF